MIWLVLTVFVLLGYSLQSVAGSVYYSMVMQAYGTVSSPPVILEAGTAGTSTIYTNNTSAKVNVSAPSPYYPSSANVVVGTYESGTMTSLQAVDSDWYIVNSTGSGASTSTYNPSARSLLGYTTDVSGTVTDLTTDNSVYMIFRSYPTGFSSTTYTRAIIGYRSDTGANGLSSPKSRTWNGSVWTSESEMSTAGSSVRFVRVASSPLGARYYERILVALSDDGYLDAYVWNGSSWLVTGNIGFVGTTANDYRCFDVEYERTNGRGMLVYGVSSTDIAKDMAYRVWNGSQWSSENYINIATIGTDLQVYWVATASKPTSNANEIALVCIDGTDSDAYGFIWNGSTWGNEKQLTDSVPTGFKDVSVENIAVAYEQQSGEATFVYATDSDAYSWQWNGSAWDAAGTKFDLTGTADPQWFSLKADPTSDRLMVCCVDYSTDLNTADWDGTVWTLHAEHDSTIDRKDARCADVDWEPSGSKVLMVWSTSANYLHYKTWTPAGGWSGASSISMDASHAWVQLRRNPRDVTGDLKILGATIDGNRDLGSLEWNGSALTGVAGAFTADVGLPLTQESFELAFQILGDPTEYTSEVEFTGTSNTEIWSQLVWTVDSSWDVESVTVTIQVYNYTLEGYSTSGDGYLSYVSSSTPDTDETKTQIITTNPQSFGDSSGNWKIKVKGVKSTSSQFQFKCDWIEYKTTYGGGGDYTASTEFIFSGMTTQTPMQLNFTVVSQYDIATVSVTLQVWNYSSSSYVTSGQGYLTYNSSSTPNADETRSLVITTNPQFFTSAGSAKIKVTGQKTTATQFQQKTNLVRLNYQSKYDYVLKIVNQVESSWQIRLKAYNQLNMGRLLNCTIYFHNSAVSRQIYVHNGAYDQQIGDWYDLPGSGTDYIAIATSATGAGASYVYVYLESLTPGTSTYSQFIITFEVN